MGFLHGDNASQLLNHNSMDVGFICVCKVFFHVKGNVRVTRLNKVLVGDINTYGTLYVRSMANVTFRCYGYGLGG